MARRWGARLAALVGLVLGACFAGDVAIDRTDIPVAASPAVSTRAPVVLASATADVTGEAQATATAAPPREIPPPPVPTLTATPVTDRAAEAIIQLDTLVALRLGGRVVVASTGWAVTFREVVDDSRCPEDVQCIWAGQVVVRLVAEHTDGRVAALTLTMPAGGPATAMLGALRVEALGIDPMPRAGAPRPLSYVLALRVGLPQAPVSSARSGVQGRVTIGPMCPVMRADDPCPDRPYRAILVVRDSAGREVARVESSDDGTYSIPLPPGTYVMEPQSPSASRLPWASPQSFIVPATGWTILDIAFDSGIR